MAFLNRFAQGVADAVGVDHPGENNSPTRDGSAKSERTKLKDYQIIELKRLLRVTRQQLDTIQFEHNADVEELSQKVEHLQKELYDVKATQLKEAALYEINLRESEEETESLKKQLQSMLRSIMANKEVEQQFDDLVDEIIADAVTTNATRELTEDSGRRESDHSSIISGGEESLASLSLDHVSRSPMSARQIATFNGGESLASLASHGTTTSKMGDARVVARLKRQLSRSLQRMETLTNQMAVVRQTCDKIITSIRQECEEQLEKRTRNEVELLNQISELEAKMQADKAKMQAELQHKEDEMENLRESADFYQEALRELEGTIQHLQSELAAHGQSTQTGAASGDEAGAAARSAARDMLKLEQSLEAVKKENELLQKNRKVELEKKDQRIQWLEQENYVKDQALKEQEAAAAHGDEALVKRAQSFDLQDIRSRGRVGSSDMKDMRSQMKNMRMMSPATGLAVKSPGKRSSERSDSANQGIDADTFVKNMHESWSPEGLLGRSGSAEKLMEQQEKLSKVWEE